jgi:hypothetical protein
MVGSSLRWRSLPYAVKAKIFCKGKEIQAISKNSLLVEDIDSRVIRL